MKVLTVWQPWAQLLAAGYKHNETRSWRTNYRGEILIHASKKPYSQTERLMTAKSRKLIRDTLGLGFIDWRQRIPTGVIIGKAKLTDCKLIDESYYQFTRDLCPEEFVYGDSHLVAMPGYLRSRSFLRIRYQQQESRACGILTEVSGSITANYT